MTRGRDTAAENIGSLLDALRGQQVSGWLRAKYSQGGYLEEGELYILTGQPIYARTGNQSGHEALDRMLGWRNIYFSFASDQARPQANLFPERVRRDMTGPLRQRNRPPSAASSPASWGTPGTGMDLQSPMRGLQSTEFPSVVGNYPNTGKFPPLTNNSPHTDVLPPLGDLTRAEQIVPHKVGRERTALTLPLTRRQRFIYFLVDGQRTIAAVARCANKSVLETELILRELQEQALVEL